MYVSKYVCKAMKTTVVYKNKTTAQLNTQADLRNKTSISTSFVTTKKHKEKGKYKKK
jgi:hypothetical protein